MTAKSQLEEARRLGHEFSITRRDNPNFPEAPAKFWLSCTCGYRSTARRSEKAALNTIVWHMAKVLADADENSAKNRAEMRRNGLAF